MRESTPVRLAYQSKPFIRGSAWRAARMMGGVSSLILALGLGGMWHFARDPIATKLAVTLTSVAVAVAAVAVVSVIAASSVARVRDGRLEFSVLGVRTRSFSLDNEQTTFETRRLGRLRTLMIISAGRTYVPNIAHDEDKLAAFLRARGVPEHPAT